MESGVAGGSDGSRATLSFTVKFSSRSIPIANVIRETTIRDLKTLLQPLTNVLPRGQKLICKGKLLVDGMTLRKSEVANGSKIMLMASKGLRHGDGPILKEAQTHPISRPNNANASAKVKTIDKNRSERWKRTGIVGLGDHNLKAIPDEVWACGTSARVFDLTSNSI